MFDKSISDGRCPRCLSDTVLRRSFFEATDDVNYRTRIYRVCKNKTCLCLFKIATNRLGTTVSECESELDYGDFDLNSWEARHRMNCTEETDTYFIYVNKNVRTMISKSTPVPVYKKEKIEVIENSKNKLKFRSDRPDFDYEISTHIVFVDGNTRTFIAKNFGKSESISFDDKEETLIKLKALGQNISSFIRNN